jgi:CspA family cold shock protein
MNGTVKWFDDSRGFGFIGTEQGDVFCHASGILFGLKVAVGDQVTFDVAPDKKSGRNKAINVRLADREAA